MQYCHHSELYLYEYLDIKLGSENIFGDLTTLSPSITQDDDLTTLSPSVIQDDDLTTLSSSIIQDDDLTTLSPSVIQDR